MKQRLNMWVILLLFLLLNVSKARECFSGQFHTDTTKRNVYRCVGEKWSFHGKLMRPRHVDSMKILKGFQCHNNPNLFGTISGFLCNDKTELNLLFCDDTRYQYICMGKEWKIYRIPPKK